eukprot:338197-Chlamydomonas_euryale.AAC.1
MRFLRKKIALMAIVVTLPANHDGTACGRRACGDPGGAVGARAVLRFVRARCCVKGGRGSALGAARCCISGGRGAASHAGAVLRFGRAQVFRGWHDERQGGGAAFPHAHAPCVRGVGAVGRAGARGGRH